MILQNPRAFIRLPQLRDAVVIQNEKASNRFTSAPPSNSRMLSWSGSYAITAGRRPQVRRILQLNLARKARVEDRPGKNHKPRLVSPSHSVLALAAPTILPALNLQPRTFSPPIVTHM